MLIEKLRSAFNTAPKVIIDCQFEDCLSRKERARLAQQLRRAYSSNKACDKPLHLIFASLSESSEFFQICCKQNDGFSKYVVDRRQDSVKELFSNDQVVYLSPDSSNVLAEFKSDIIYVIGGIVDESTNKNLSLGFSHSSDITTARLPIDEYFVAKKGLGTFKKVLTVNQVFDIILEWYKNKDWQYLQDYQLELGLYQGRIKNKKSQNTDITKNEVLLQFIPRLFKNCITTDRHSFNISKKSYSTSSSPNVVKTKAKGSDNIIFPLKVNLDVVRKEFRQLTGGQVVLTKDNETGVAYICLDHIEKKNGLSGSMMVDLNEIVTNLENWDDGKSIVLHAKGDTFCSGGYLETVKQICNHQDGYKMSSLMHDTVIRLAKLPLVSVSVVQGKALGGGAELMLATDFRLFTNSAHCSFVEAKMGVGTGWGGGTLLRRLLGPSKALQLLLSCKKVGATDAINMGLADDLVSDENSLEDATKWILNLVGEREVSVIHTVKQIVACDNFDEEKRLFSLSWGGEAQIYALNRNIKHK